MSKNNNITVDEEFRDLLPPLPGDVYEKLEESIRSEGCRDAIVLWDDVIVDGHNRYAICQKHRIAFQRIKKEFASRDEAKIWIISTQLARRQLSGEEAYYYRGMQYNLEKKVIGAPSGNKNALKNQCGNNDHIELPTAQRLADQYNVSERTIRLDAEAADAIGKIGDVSPAAKKKILTGESGVSKKELVKLNKVSGEEISAAAGKIADGTYKKKEKPAAKASAAENKPPVPAEPPIDEPAEEPAPEQPDEPASEPSLHIPEGWDMPETIQGKKQTWCAFISAGIDALGGVIGNIEKDLRNKLPLVESQAERDFLRQNFQSYIDKQLEIIKQI